MREIIPGFHRHSTDGGMKKQKFDRNPARTTDRLEEPLPEEN
jgi:hypothetical protein